MVIEACIIYNAWGVETKSGSTVGHRRAVYLWLVKVSLRPRASHHRRTWVA